MRKFIFRIMFFIIVHCVLYFRYDYDGIFEATPGCRRAVRTAIEAAEKNGIKVIPFRPFGLREAFKLNSSYRGVFICNVYTFSLSLANMGTYSAQYTRPLALAGWELVRGVDLYHVRKDTFSKFCSEGQKKTVSK